MPRSSRRIGWHLYKVLTDTLRRVERDGLVARHFDVARVETTTLYELTDIGRSLDLPLSVLAKWVDAKSSDPQGPYSEVNLLAWGLVPW